MGKGVCEQPEGGHPAWSTGLCALPGETLSGDTPYSRKQRLASAAAWPRTFQLSASLAVRRCYRRKPHQIKSWLISSLRAEVGRERCNLRGSNR